MKSIGAVNAGGKVAGSAAADMILTGAGLAAAAPVGTGDSRLENAAWGTAGGAVLPVAGAVVRGAKNAAAPFTQGGSQRIAGEALLDAGMPAQFKAEEIVLGSRPSTVEATQVPGLAQMQKALTNRNPNFRADLDTLAAEQNLARWNALRGVTGTADDITAAAAARDAKALPILESAMNRAKKPDTQALLDVNAMLAGGSTRLRTNASEALATIRDKLSASKSANDLYAVRKEIDDMLKGRVGADSKGAQYAAEELMQMKGAIDDALNQATGGRFGKYLETYVEGSKPVNRMEASQKFASKFEAASPDAFGIPNLTLGRWNQAMHSPVTLPTGGSATTRTQLGETLNVGDMGVLSDIERDLMRQFQAQKLVAARGSDTVQNIAGDNLLMTALRAAPKPTGTGGLLSSAAEWYANARSRRPMAELERGLLSPEYAKALANAGAKNDPVIRGLLSLDVDPALMLSEIARMSAARSLPSVAGQ